MNLMLVSFIAAAVILVGLLLWAIRPAEIKFRSTEEVFETLSAPRHYYRLPQILQALQTKDTEFLRERGHPELCERVRAERKGIALEFVSLLEKDYQTLIEASRVLAAMTPEVVAADEWQRFRLSLGFAWGCRLLRFRLRTSLRPWNGFARLSERAGQLSYRLELATTQIGERAAIASELPSLLEDRGGKPR